MKSLRLACLLVVALGIIPLQVFCISCLQLGPDTIKTATTIIGSCIIAGNLVIVDGGALHVDLTGGQPDTFIVRGNILLQGNAVLLIDADSGSTNAQFIVSNTSNNEQTITTQGSSRVILQYVQFLTQEGNLSGASSYYMNYNAQDSSAFSVTGCFLNTQTAWLLCNMFDNSTLIVDQSMQVPTEVYLQDSAQISVTGAGTNIGLWLLFTSTTDTLNLPNQTEGPFNWQVGRGQGGVRASQWFLNVADATPGIGVQVQPFAKLVVNGIGSPATGEVHANLLFANSTDTANNLRAGLQNGVFANGRLTLNNVNMGPLGWQLYSVSNENLTIENSTVNEIGVVGPNNIVEVDSSVLQLATLSGLGSNGSRLNINACDIWNQAIIAANTCIVNINNCNVTGSWFSTDGQSQISVIEGCFFANPGGCTENTMVNISTGVPNCNPYIPAGMPNIVTPATVTLHEVNNNCASSVENVNGNNPYITIYPNPFSTETSIQTGAYFSDASLAVYNALGQQVKQIMHVSGPTVTLQRGNLATGVYFIRLTTQNNVSVTGKMIITDN